jgi:alkylation response protein AidB-like acyl-CoA dehydrogenase
VSTHRPCDPPGARTLTNTIRAAQQLADELLFPAALETDASDAVPVELLDALAEASLYGIVAPPDVGGVSADFGTVCAVLEALSSGCLTTAFLWMQHIGLVRALTYSDNEDLQARWLKPLANGEIRAGLALGGALPKPSLRAAPDGDGWLLDGVSPFVSGWGRVNVLHAAARTPGDDIVWLIVDAAEKDVIRTERLRLMALNATSTVKVTFSRLRVSADRVTGMHPASGVTQPEVLRTHAALALGVTARCCRMLGPTGLDAELAAVRTRLDQLGPDTAAARAAAGELAVRAASSLMTAEGSKALLASAQAQRLAREALFTRVYALRPASRSAALTALGTTELA